MKAYQYPALNRSSWSGLNPTPLDRDDAICQPKQAECSRCRSHTPSQKRCQLLVVIHNVRFREADSCLLSTIDT
jgi:hypothetical protein